jgi:hypothetical protein
MGLSSSCCFVTDQSPPLSRVAKNDDASLSTRASAAKDAISDKMDESKHDAKAETNKQKVKN